MIFEDPSHRRWRRAIAVFALLVVAALTALAFTVAGIIVPPHVPNLFSERPEVKATLVQASLEHDPRPIVTPQEQKRLQVVRAQERKRRDKLVSGKTGGPMPLPPGAVVGFTTDDPKSVASLERHVANIDVVVPDWFELPGRGLRADRAHRRQDAPRARSLPMPWCCRASPTSRATSGAARETSQVSRGRRTRAQCLVKKLVDRLAALGAGGINLDLEELQPEDSEPFLELIVELRAALHAQVDAADRRRAVPRPGVRLRVHRRRRGRGDGDGVRPALSGVEAGPDRFATWLTSRYDEVLPRLPADRVVVVLGNYGYDWTLDASPEAAPRDLSFRAAMDLARAAERAPVFEEELENGHFGYRDRDGDNARRVVPGRARDAGIRSRALAPAAA